MKKLKAAMLATGAVATIGGATATVATTNATGNTDKHGDWNNNWSWWNWSSDRDRTYDASLAESLSDRFDLEKGEVEEAIDDVRDKQNNEKQQVKHDKLASALKNEDITQAQHDKVSAIYTEIDTLVDSLNNVEGEEYKDVIKQISEKKDELKSYLEAEDLSWSDIGYKSKHSKK